MAPPRAAKRAQAAHGGRQGLEDPVNLGVGGGRAETESNSALDARIGQAERAQDVRGFERARRARRSGRDGDALEVERDDQRFAFDALETDVRGVRHAAIAIAVDHRSRHPLEDAALETISERSDSSVGGDETLAGQLRGDTQSDERRHIFSACATAPLLSAACQNRREADAAANPDGAHAFGAAELVRRYGQHVDAERHDVDRYLAGRLDRVGVEQGAGFVRDSRQIGDRLNRANLIVGMHHRHDGRIGLHRASEIVGLDDTQWTDRQLGDPPALPGHRVGRHAHRLVLERADHDVPFGRGGGDS